MGQLHLTSMAKNEGVEVAAVCELDAERRQVAEEDFPGIKTYGRVGTMLRNANLDLVTIITPHNTHAKLAVQCLNAGVHVVCEKPLAITSAEVKRMQAAAKKNKAMISTFHNRRWDGDFVVLRDLILKEQIIGPVFRIEAGFYGYGEQGTWWRSNRKNLRWSHLRLGGAFYGLDFEYRPGKNHFSQRLSSQKSRVEKIRQRGSLRIHAALPQRLHCHPDHVQPVDESAAALAGAGHQGRNRGCGRQVPRQSADQRPPNEHRGPLCRVQLGRVLRKCFRAFAGPRRPRHYPRIRGPSHRRPRSSQHLGGARVGAHHASLCLSKSCLTSTHRRNCPALLGIGCRSGATVVGLSAVRRAKGLALVFASSDLAQRTLRELARLERGGTRVFQVQPMEVLTQGFGREDAQVIGVLRGDLARGLAKHIEEQES